MRLQEMRAWLSRRAIDAVAVAIVVIAAASIPWIYRNWSATVHRSDTPHPPKTPLSLRGATLKGNPEAPLVLIEYFDYQCPYCKTVETQILPRLVKQYINSGAVELAVRHHPLEEFHPRARQAAEAALCAGRQGKFWEMHAALFEHQQDLDTEILVHLAGTLELDVHDFEACVQGDVVRQVQADSREARELGLSGTPAFLIGTRTADGRVRVSSVLVGAQPIGEFQKALDGARPRHISLRRYFVVWLVGVAVPALVALGLVRHFARRRTRWPR